VSDELTVVVADGDAATLSRVRRTLEGDGFNVVAEAHDAAEALDAALRHRPRLCLVEADLPGDGLLASSQIYANLPRTRIAVLTAAVVEEEALLAIRAGADGYMLKGNESGRLGAALRAVAAGEPALPRALTAHFVRELRRDAQTGHGWLNRTLLYLPRFIRHFRRRRRAHEALGMAWQSTRVRMREYR